jgi:ribosomal protein S18 acetylase RimI-like enzyme
LYAGILMMEIKILIRPAENCDLPAMAAIRANESQTGAFWIDRITRYLRGEHHPQQALPERAMFVAVAEGCVVGFVAGHRTRRFDCDGELQWIDVAAELRGQRIAGRLLAAQLKWFRARNALRICVNVAPENGPARRLYAANGAVAMNPHWMIWELS